MRKIWLTAYEWDIQLEMFQIGHHNLLAAAIGGLGFIPLVTAAAWSSAPRRGMLLWLGVSALSNLCSWGVWRWFRRPVTQLKAGVPPAAAMVRRWMWAHLAVMTALGAATGAFGALYQPADSMHNLFVAVAFQGAVAYSAAGNSTHDLPAFLMSMVVAGLLMSGFIPTGFGRNAWQMIGLCWLFVGTLTWVAVQAHQAIVRTIRLQIANRRLADEQALAAARAEQANRGKSEFLAAASHDLRQPVHALVLLIEALRQERRSLAAPLTQQDILIDSIGNAGQAISHLFNELMELSRLESGHQPLLPTLLDLPALLQQAQARHATEAAQQGLQLRLRIGRRAQQAQAHTDRVMLERVLANLLSNALRYTARGGVLITLRSRATAGAPRWLLGIHDSGQGIAAADQQRIFDPYVQLDNAERDRSKGLGLGLAIVRQCVQRMGVPLRLQSQPGRGSHFVIELSAARADAVDPTPRPATRTTPPPAPTSLRGRCLLLIDDDALVRQAMGELLRSWGLDLRVASHAEDPALADLVADNSGSWTPELLLCDYRLPGPVQGIALLSRLQERWPHAATLLQTGEPRERVQEAAEEAGYAVLYKPIAPALLASTLQALFAPRADQPCGPGSDASAATSREAL